MTDSPIIFSAPMIRALLAGTKTQTRRVLKMHPQLSGKIWRWGVCAWWDGPPYIPHSDELAMDRQPHAIGDLVWVKETFSESPFATYYRATEEDPATVKWISPRFMPRAASRLTLEVTGVKVERVQDISEEDAKAEGCEESSVGHIVAPARGNFSLLWDSIHGPGAWERNEWVYALTFRVHKCNIDALGKVT